MRIKVEAREIWLPYDYLIIALGSRVERDLIPGVEDHAFSLDPYGSLTTEALKARLASFGDEPFRVAVVGGGARGAAIRVLKGRTAVSAFILGTVRFRPMGLKYELVSLNRQKAIMARTPDSRPYFVIFVYGDGRSLNLIHVIAGKKLQALVA